MKTFSPVIFSGPAVPRLSGIRGEHGISHFVVILFVILACIGMVTAYILGSRLSTTIEKVKEEEKKREAIDNEYLKINKALIEVSPLIKDVPELKPVEVVDIRKYLEEKIKQYGLVSKIDREAEIGGEDVTLEVIIREAARELTESEICLNRAQYGRIVSESRLEKFRDILTAVEDIRRREKDELQAKLNTLSQREITETGNYDRRIEELTREIERIDNEVPRIEKNFKDRKINLRNQIALTIQKLEQLSLMETISRDVTVAHGTIFNADVANSYAFINLGKEQGITRGLKFRVFRKAKSGMKHWKGQVEVKQVFDTYSQVSITKVENPIDPITDGDLIANIFYDKASPPRVVLVGEMKRPDFKFDLAEIKRRLTDLGVVVEKTISLRTDFVIIGKNPEAGKIDQENYYWAKKLGLPRFEDQEARDCIEYYLGD